MKHIKTLIMSTAAVIVLTGTSFAATEVLSLDNGDDSVAVVSPSDDYDYGDNENYYNDTDDNNSDIYDVDDTDEDDLDTDIRVYSDDDDDLGVNIYDTDDEIVDID